MKDCGCSVDAGLWHEMVWVVCLDTGPWNEALWVVSSDIVQQNERM